MPLFTFNNIFSGFYLHGGPFNINAIRVWRNHIRSKNICMITRTHPDIAIH